MIKVLMRIFVSRTNFTTSVNLLVNYRKVFALITAGVSIFDFGNSQFHKAADSIIDGIETNLLSVPHFG